MPNDAMCYIAGLGKLSHRRFSIANLLGRGIACVFTSAVGVFGATILWQVWTVVIVIVVIGGITWLIRRNCKAKILLGR